MSKRSERIRVRGVANELCLLTHGGHAEALRLCCSASVFRPSALASLAWRFTDTAKTAKNLLVFTELFHAFPRPPMQKSSWSDPQRFRHTSLDLSIERHLQSLPCRSILAQFLTGWWVSSHCKETILRICTSLLRSLGIENVKLKRWSFKLLRQNQAPVAQQNIKAIKASPLWSPSNTCTQQYTSCRFVVTCWLLCISAFQRMKNAMCSSFASGLDHFSLESSGRVQTASLSSAKNYVQCTWIHLCRCWCLSCKKLCQKVRKNAGKQNNHLMTSLRHGINFLCALHSEQCTDLCLRTASHAILPFESVCSATTWQSKFFASKLIYSYAQTTSVPP